MRFGITAVYQDDVEWTVCGGAGRPGRPAHRREPRYPLDEAGTDQILGDDSRRGAVTLDEDALAAPGESASIPPAPEPAKRSRTAAPARSGSRIAKRVCLTRSPRGRVPSPGAVKRVPLAEPAMTRPHRSFGRLCGCGLRGCGFRGEASVAEAASATSPAPRPRPTRASQPSRNSAASASWPGSSPPSRRAVARPRRGPGPRARGPFFPQRGDPQRRRPL